MAPAGEQHDRIRQTITRLFTRICAHTHLVAQRLGLGDTDSRFLALLALHGSLTPSQLAALSGLTTGAVTGVLNRLERADFVRREPDTTDRRRVHVAAAPAATARIAAEYTPWIDLLDSAIHRRNPADLAIIARFVAELTSGEGPHNPPTKQPPLPAGTAYGTR